jgi:hypothetical protein
MTVLYSKSNTGKTLYLRHCKTLSCPLSGQVSAGLNNATADETAESLFSSFPLHLSLFLLLHSFLLDSILNTRLDCDEREIAREYE